MPSHLTLTVGNVEIIALTDMSFPFPMTLDELWPDVPADAWNEYRQRYPDTFHDDLMLIEIGCYLLCTPEQTILIDTGYGPGPIESIGGLEGELMDHLKSQNVQPGEVDTVFLSHLHSDHVGWNTIQQDGQFVPAFPNARYVVHQEDLDHFRRPDIQANQSIPFMKPSVERLVDLGLLDTLTEDDDLTPEVRALHTPGHTPGHMSVLVSSQGQQALIEGDVFVHPAQITEAEWNCHFDYDWPLSNVTRRAMLKTIEDENTTVVACHFPLPGYGHVVRENGKRYWKPSSNIPSPSTGEG